MYQVWKIERGSTILIDAYREASRAQSAAIEQSRIEDAIHYVCRAGFDTPLYFVWRGFLGGPEEIIRRQSVQAFPVLTLEPAEPEEAPRPRRRKAAPSEAKGKRGEPDTIKVYPTTVTAIDEEQGVVEAIVNVFGIVDDGDDVVHLGAFTKTLAEAGTRVRVLDGHNNRSTLSIVGKPLDIREVGRDELPPAVLMQYPDATGGLYTKTQYLLNTPEGRGVFERIKAGALSEYSIGFDALDTNMERLNREGQTQVVRHIRQVRLWEYSPVVFGMNPATATVSVKSADEPNMGAGNGLPDDAIAEEHEHKVGRVLSARNFEAIKQAYELLSGVMASAGLNDEGEAAEEDAAKALELQHEHAADGPLPDSTDAPTSLPEGVETGPQDDETPATKQAELLSMLEQRLAEVEAEHDHERTRGAL